VSEASPSFPRHVSLDELIAFNEEIMLLAKAGVPLEEGLVDAAEDFHGRIGQISSALGERLQSGQSLDKVLAEFPELFSPAYAAVAAAGIRSGRLPAALESLGTSLRRLVDLQRTMRLSLIYPFIIAGMAQLFFVASLAWLAPASSRSFSQALGFNHFVPRLLREMHDALWWWAVLPPLGLAALVLVFLIALRRDKDLAPLGQRLLHNGQTAIFCEILAMLVEHGTPVEEALELAGRSCGRKRIADSAARLAAMLRDGQTPESVNRFPGLPPVLVCLLLPGPHLPALAVRLRRHAEARQRQVRRRLENLQQRLPVLLLLLIGCTAVLAFVCWSLWPLAYVIWDLISSLRTW
jgi:general secretion pathway protein F